MCVYIYIYIAVCVYIYIYTHTYLLQTKGSVCCSSMHPRADSSTT